MGDVINLNRFRKARSKADKEKQAEENRIRYGRSKSDRVQAGTARERLEQDLDGKKLS